MNLWELGPLPIREERVEELYRGEGVRVERIVSTGQASPEGFWYDQEEDEWLVLLQGESELRFADGSRRTLRAGDTMLLPAHRRHRVDSTSQDPPCIWLCVFCRRAPGQKIPYIHESKEDSK